MKEDVSKLGKMLISQLNSKDNPDMLTSWMAYYISELMDRADNTEDAEKKDMINEKCAAAIIELWKHRGSFPKEINPLRNFIPIFNTLERIDPDNPRFFFNYNYNESKEEKGEGLNEVSKWLNVVETIDRSARICIEYALNQAAECATDETTKVWISTVLDESAEREIVITSKLLGMDADQDDDSVKQRFKTRIDQLNRFNQLIEDIYKTELADLEQTN